MIDDFLKETVNAISRISVMDINRMAEIIDNSNRLFIIGSGGGAGQASHACSDFRKLCRKETYAPYDNVTELTARTNDEGFQTTAIEYLITSRFNQSDCLFVFSVGGGKDGVSQNLMYAMNYAKETGAKIVGITAKRDSVLYMLADACVVIDVDKYITPITEGLQSVVFHLLVTILQKNKTVW